MFAISQAHQQSSVDIQNLYSEVKYLGKITSCDTIGCSKFSNPNHVVYCHLYNGKCQLSLQNKISAAYNSYLSAYNLIDETSLLLKREILSNIIELNTDNLLNVEETYFFLRELKSLAKTSKDSCLYNFYELRYNRVKNIIDRNDNINSLNISKEIEAYLNIAKCFEDWNDNFYATKCRLSLGVLYESIDQYERAIENYDNAMIKSLKVNSNYHEYMNFACNANLIPFELRLGYFEKALVRAHKIKNSKMLKNPMLNSYFYDWISQAYDSLNIQDSAYFYLKLKNESDIKLNKAIELKSTVENQADFNERKLIDTRNKWFIILSAIIGVLTLGGYFIYRFQSLKKKAVESELETTKVKAAYDATVAKMEGEQEERQEIASVLHDQIASLLTAANMHLSAANKKDKSEDNPLLDKAGNIIKDVNEQVRNLSHQLVSPTLLKFGLSAGLASLTDKMQAKTLLIEQTSDLGDQRFAQSKETFLYNTASEFIQNVIKHSNATQVNIELKLADNNMLELSVKDNGTNATLADSLGLGLTHIKNKSEALGGHMLTDFSEKGFAVMVAIPA